MLSIFKNKTKDIFIPIGRGCHNAMLLDKLGLRQCSYPMDWIIPYHSSEFIEQRFNFLINGFKDFFNQDDLEKEDAVSPTTGHARVFNKYTGLWFFHDFNSNKSIKEQFKSIQKKYKKRAIRCCKHIKQAKIVNLTYIQNTWDQIDYKPAILDEDVLKICMNRLKKKYPKQKFRLYIFEHNPNFAIKYYEKYEIYENITKFISNHSYTENNEKLGMILSIEKIFKEEVKTLARVERERERESNLTS